jgi:hypothetical protein
MRYSICAFEEYETVGGIIEERPLKPIEKRTSNEAEKLVKKMAESGKYSTIYIHYNHKDSDCYYNPIVGFEPVGKDWISHFDN